MKEAFPLTSGLLELGYDLTLIRQLQVGHLEETEHAVIQDIIDSEVEHCTSIVHRKC